MAIAASGAAGLRANFGTMVKPLHAGLAAQTGVRAALLAKAGYDASVDIFEHECGYFSVLRGDGASNPEIMRAPGEAFELLYEFGLALKPYPCCGATHPSIEAAIEIHKWMGGRNGLQDVRSVRVGSSRFASVPLIYKNPTTPLQGKFSLEFCVAAGIADGHVNLGTFIDEKIRDPAIRLVQGKLLVEVDGRVAVSPEFGAAVSVTMSDQRTHEVLVPFAKGKPDRWMSPSDIEAKLIDCFRFAGAEGAKEAFAVWPIPKIRGRPLNCFARCIESEVVCTWKDRWSRQRTLATACGDTIVYAHHVGGWQIQQLRSLISDEACLDLVHDAYIWYGHARNVCSRPSRCRNSRGRCRQPRTNARNLHARP